MLPVGPKPERMGYRVKQGKEASTPQPDRR